MLTAIVTFPLKPEIDADSAKAMFEASAPRYKDLPGLVRKYYLFEPGLGGGVYLWTDKASAEACYSDAFKASIAERFGAAPTIRFFETPVIVDNAETVAEAETASA